MPEYDGGDYLPEPGDVAADAAAVLEAYKSGKPLVVQPRDPSEAQAEIAERMLTSKTWEELAGGSPAIKGKEFINTPLKVTDVRWFPSKHYEPDNPKRQPPAFAVIRGHLIETSFAGAAGDEVIVSAGGWNVFAFLLKAQSEGWLFPPDGYRTLVIRTTEKPTAQNRYPIFLEDWDLAQEREAKSKKAGSKS